MTKNDSKGAAVVASKGAASAATDPGKGAAAQGAPAATKVAQAAAPERRRVLVSQVEVIPGWNPTHRAEKTADLETVARETGILPAIGVIENPNKRGFLAIYGERRLSTVKKVGWTEIDVDIYTVDMKTAFIIHTAENTARQDLSSYEEADAYCRIKRENPGMTEQTLSDKVGRPFSSVNNLIRTRNNLAPEICEAWRLAGEGKGECLPFKELIAIAAEKSKATQVKMFKAGGKGKYERSLNPPTPRPGSSDVEYAIDLIEYGPANIEVDNEGKYSTDGKAKVAIPNDYARGMLAALKWVKGEADKDHFFKLIDEVMSKGAEKAPKGAEKAPKGKGKGK